MQSFFKDNIQEVLESSVSLSSQAIYWLDEEGHLLFANDNALSTLGYTLEELQKLMLWDVDANVNTKEKYLDAVSNFKIESPDESSSVLETTHKKKNGEIFPVEVVSKFKEINGKEFLISYARDITDRLKRIEDINFYFELINSSKDMIFLAEQGTGVLEFANKTACELLGYSLDELKRMKVSEFRKPFDNNRKIELPEVFKKIQEKKEMTTYGIFITKTGEEIPVETSLHLKNYHDRKFLVAISRDIKDRISIEKEREELSDKLKDYNKVLKEEIEKANEELIEYEGIMKKQSKMAAMGEMIENIAHQWRQPLSAISVLSTGMILQNEQDMLNKDLLDAGLNDINEHSQYLSKTIDDFRNFFKPNKSKNYFYIEQLINNTIKLTKARYTNTSIEFKTDIVNTNLYTYENELLQVLLNIIVNAIDELLKVDRIKLIFIEAKSDNDYFELKIKDNAGGIDEGILDRVFEPYFTTKHKYQGTGIGLYMSENIIKHMNGTLEATNVDIKYKEKRYRGACFKIRIPL